MMHPRASHPHPAGPPRRSGHVLTEALVAMTVLLLGSTMIAQTALAILRADRIATARTAALDSLGQRIGRHWLRACTTAPDRSRAEAADVSGVRVTVEEYPHASLGSKGLVLRAHWSQQTVSGVDSVAITASSGQWCPP